MRRARTASAAVAALAALLTGCADNTPVPAAPATASPAPANAAPRNPRRPNERPAEESDGLVSHMVPPGGATPGASRRLLQQHLSPAQAARGSSAVGERLKRPR